MPLNEFNDQRALVVGLGVEGVAMARFLAAKGAAVTVADAKPAGALREPLAELDGIPLTYALGGVGPELLAGADVLYLSQSVPLAIPLVVEARRAAAPVRSIVTLAYEVFFGRVAAITGSSGKTTTTALVAAIFAAAGRAHILAGNIGVWPLDELAGASMDDWAVMEISHTQLQLTQRSPHVACVTNVTPNHLDQFSWEEYVALKRNHIAHQSPLDIAVLNLDNAVTREFRTKTAAEVLGFSMAGDIPGDGAFVRGDAVTWRRNGRETTVLSVADIPLRGRHNVENVLAATATAGAAGIDMGAVADAVRGFTAVPHRLEPVGLVDGVAWYNDSIATAPERTLAGMRSFSEPLVLLLGGRDKKLPLEALAAECAARCRAVVAFGEAGELFAAAVNAARSTAMPQIVRVEKLSEAVDEAARLSRPGDVVLLAPAGTSFDAYPNFARRGEEFRRLVHDLAQTARPA